MKREPAFLIVLVLVVGAAYLAAHALAYLLRAMNTAAEVLGA